MSLNMVLGFILVAVYKFTVKMFELKLLKLNFLWQRKVKEILQRRRQKPYLTVS